MALSLWPRRAYRSPIVLETVSSLGSALRTFSYSAMAFCSLPCWTNFSAELSTFALLNPNPSAIESLNEGSFYRRGDHSNNWAKVSHSPSQNPAARQIPLGYQ